jgi:hypothetical protein
MYPGLYSHPVYLIDPQKKDMHIELCNITTFHFSDQYFTFYKAIVGKSLFFKQLQNCSNIVRTKGRPINQTNIFSNNTPTWHIHNK